MREHAAFVSGKQLQEIVFRGSKVSLINSPSFFTVRATKSIFNWSNSSTLLALGKWFLRIAERILAINPVVRKGFVKWSEPHLPMRRQNKAKALKGLGEFQHGNSTQEV